MSFSQGDVLSVLPDPVVVLNNKRDMVFVNKELLDLLDYSEEALIGKSIDVLIPKRYHEKCTRYLIDFIESDNQDLTASFELFGLKNSGIEVDIQIGMSKWKNDGEELLVALFRDISNSHMIERKYQQNTQYLMKVNEDLEKFDHIIAHDLKSPLNNIKSIINLMTAEIGDQQQKQLAEYFNLLNRCVDSMSNMITEILTAQRLNPQKQDKVNIKNVLEEVVSILYMPPNVDINYEEDQPLITGDKIIIRQIFINLIDNAIKYNDKDQGKVWIDWESENGDYKFMIRDNGPGIEQERQKQIFDQYETTGNEDSFGLGLYTIKNILDEMGGEISVDSEIGKGSCFSFSLPKK